MTYSNDITNKARRNLGGKCKFCGDFEKLEFAHIFFDGYKDVNINGRRLSGRSLIQKHLKFNTLRERIMLLCTTCHRRYDTVTMAQLAEEALLRHLSVDTYKRIIEND